MTKNKNKKSSEAAKQEAFKLSDGICYCKTPEIVPVHATVSTLSSPPFRQVTITAGRGYIILPGFHEILLMTVSYSALRISLRS